MPMAGQSVSSPALEFRQNKLGDGGAGNILFSICASVAMSSVLTIHCYVNVALLIIFYYHDQFCQLSNAAIFYINYKSLFSYPCTQQFLQYNRCLSYCSFHFYHHGGTLSCVKYIALSLHMQ